jgi:hypothetical protein
VTCSLVQFSGICEWFQAGRMRLSAVLVRSDCRNVASGPGVAMRLGHAEDPVAESLAEALRIWIRDTDRASLRRCLLKILNGLEEE